MTRAATSAVPGRSAAAGPRVLLLVPARSGPVDAVVAADTPMLALAAAIAARMGLPHNPVEAVLNAAVARIRCDARAVRRLAQGRSAGSGPRDRPTPA